MENGPFIDDFPSKTQFFKGLSMAMFNNQMPNVDLFDYMKDGSAFVLRMDCD